MSNNLDQMYNQPSFDDVWDTVEGFVSEYKDNGIDTTISDTSAKTLYFLLYANYGNSHIASSDLNRFKYKLWSIIYQYGPNWEKQLEIQKILRDADLDTLVKGSTVILNNSMAPSTAPTTQTLDELTTINQQNVSKNKRGILDTYEHLLTLLDDSITEGFLGRFKNLFIKVVEPNVEAIYISNSED